MNKLNGIKYSEEVTPYMKEKAAAWTQRIDTSGRNNVPVRDYEGNLLIDPENGVPKRQTQTGSAVWCPIS